MPTYMIEMWLHYIIVHCETYNKSEALLNHEITKMSNHLLEKLNLIIDLVLVYQFVISIRNLLENFKRKFQVKCMD